MSPSSRERANGVFQKFWENIMQGGGRGDLCPDRLGAAACGACFFLFHFLPFLRPRGSGTSAWALRTLLVGSFFPCSCLHGLSQHDLNALGVTPGDEGSFAAHRALGASDGPPSSPGGRLPSISPKEGRFLQSPPREARRCPRNRLRPLQAPQSNWGQPPNGRGRSERPSGGTRSPLLTPDAHVQPMLLASEVPKCLLRIWGLGAALLGTATHGDHSFQSKFSRQAPDTSLETRLLTVTGVNA